MPPYGVPPSSFPYLWGPSLPPLLPYSLTYGVPPSLPSFPTPLPMGSLPPSPPSLLPYLWGPSSLPSFPTPLPMGSLPPSPPSLLPYLWGPSLLPYLCSWLSLCYTGCIELKTCPAGFPGTSLAHLEQECMRRMT